MEFRQAAAGHKSVEEQHDLRAGTDGNWQWTGSGWLKIGRLCPAGPRQNANALRNRTALGAMPTRQIVDNAGGVWTIGANQAILRNGAQAAGGFGSQILWKSATIYVLGGSTWWQWTGSGWINVGSTTPGGTTTTSSSSTSSTASPDGTTVPTATQIVDNGGAVWTIGSGSAILCDGVSAAGGYGSQTYWKSGTIYVLGGSTWWQWTGSAWINVGSSTPGGTTGSTASPDGTTVPTATQIVDNSGAVWTIGSSLAILRNGAPAGGGYGSKICGRAKHLRLWAITLVWTDPRGESWSCHPDFHVSLFVLSYADGIV
jgi:hypothetical protein